MGLKTILFERRVRIPSSAPFALFSFWGSLKKKTDSRKKATHTIKGLLGNLESVYGLWADAWRALGSLCPMAPTLNPLIGFRV